MVNDAREGYLDTDRRFADRVKELRQERGMSQEALASEMVEAGITYATQSTVSRIENKSRPVRVSEVEALLRIFRVASLSEMTSDDQRIRWIRPLRLRAAEGTKKLSDLFEAYGAMRDFIKTANNSLDLIERLRLDSDNLPDEVKEEVVRLQRTFERLTYVDAESFLEVRGEDNDGQTSDAAK